ncbi:MAG: AraC family transcriptional regulator ligand-binding domain-containing protein [Aquabacterium sp.]|uniref:AraC family transcriptional regulator n=1 Tax=Aquabacterium sp. TaxID=1872578 RepID=UPI0025C29594|nr:AraC family transcriptional regulator [Aquabacterium sp.]MBI5925178.1 AraC family transcriptional regulator ligand-binding domain-containing protein [Aquabacterium sp.]
MLAYTLDVEGFNSEGVLQRCGLRLSVELNENGEWIPIEAYERMIEDVLETTQDPSFGLVAGKSLALMRYGVMVPISMFTPSLRQLLTDIARFAALVMDRAEINLDEAPGKARLVVCPIVREGAAGKFRYELAATSALQMLKFAGLDNDDIYDVSFPYACPAGMARRYEGVFGPHLQFNQAQCAIDFDPLCLDKPLPSHDPVSYAAACTRAESALLARQSQIDTAERVRQRILAAFPQQPGIADIARALGMSERSLRRHLATLGTTHQELMRECQYLKAGQLLCANQLSIKQIADALGFSSVTSFHRAFKRWSGTTPLGWLTSQTGGDQADNNPGNSLKIKND